MGLRRLHHRSPTNARRPYQASRDSARTPRSEMEQVRALSSHNLLSKSDCQKQHGAPIVTPLGVTMTHRSHSCKMPPPDPRLFDVDFKSRAAGALRHRLRKRFVPIWRRIGESRVWARKVICLVCLLVVVMSSVRRYVMDMDSHLFEVPATVSARKVIPLYGFPSRITPSRSPFLIGKGRILRGNILPVFHLAVQVGMPESIG